MDPSQIAKHENAERILQVGWELFQEKGYRGASMDALCQRCHLTKPTLYYYFENKENLYVQVLLYRLRGFRQTIEKKGTIASRLKRLSGAMLDTRTFDMPILMRDMHQIRTVACRRQLKEAYERELLQPLSHVMQEGIDSGELAPNNPVLYTWIFMGMISPFIARPRDLGMNPRSIADQLVRFFLNGANSASR